MGNIRLRILFRLTDSVQFLGYCLVVALPRIMAQSIPGVPMPHEAFVILSVPAVGNLSENLSPGVGHLSILLEVVNIVPFSIFHSKNAYLDSFRNFYKEYF